MKKQIRHGGAWVQKYVERLSLASFVSREVRMGVALLVVTLGLMGLALFSFINESGLERVSVEPTSDVPEVTHYYHPFTGVLLTAPFEGALSVFGVMVENSYDAWPLSGVEDAFLVIEAPVEGSIPRFEAFFTSDMNTSEIGPVRSARPYYVDWAKGWDVVYAHVGGSPEALDLLKVLAIQDVNEFYNGHVFWRSTKRSAPHNAYTSIAQLAKHAVSKEFTQRSQGFFSFANPEGEIGEVTYIHYSWFTQASNYDVGWNFEEGRYTRLQGGNVAKSMDGDTYRFDNVIFLETDIRSIDEVGRKYVRTTGEGKAVLFTRGQRQEITWNKTASDAPLRFYDISNHEITFTPGNTWITIVEDLARVTSES